MNEPVDMIENLTSDLSMAQSKTDETKFVTWGQLGVFLTVVLVLLGVIGALYRDGINTQLQTLNNNVTTFGNKIGELDKTITGKFGDLDRKLDALNNRVARFEYPEFQKKAARAGVPVTFQNFKMLQAKADDFGLTDRSLVPIRLNAGFKFADEGVLHGTHYKLDLKITDIKQDTISFTVDGSIDGLTFESVEISIPLRPNTPTSLTAVLTQWTKRPLPNIWVAVLGQPTKDTAVLASGSTTTG